MEGVDDVGRLDSGEGGGVDEEPRAVVLEVEQLDRSPVRQLPGRGVDLPGLVGQPGLEADEGGTRALVRLRSYESVALEDPPDCAHRGHWLDQPDQVMGEGLRSGVEAGFAQFATQSQDFGFDSRFCLLRARPRSPRAWL